MMYGGERVVWSGMILPLGVYNSTFILTKANFLAAAFPNGIPQNFDIGGMLLELNVTAVPGVDTVRLNIEEKLPDGTLNGTALVNNTATPNTGIVRVRLGEQITATISSMTGQAIMDFVPNDWRIRVIHSGSGNFTYSLMATFYA